MLKNAGFTIGDVSDAGRSDYNTTEVHEHSTVTFAAARVREALPPALHDALVISDQNGDASPAPTGSPSSDVTVIVGTDVTRNPPSAIPGHS